VALALLAAAALAAAPGCSTWRGARLYASGTEALEAGDTATAVADLEHAAELVPGSGDVHNHLGIAYLQAGRPDAARRAFARAVALDCSDPAAAINLERLEARAAREPSDAAAPRPPTGPEKATPAPESPPPAAHDPL